MAYDKIIRLQRQDNNTEEWLTVWKLHAKVNKLGGTEKFESGAEQYHLRLTFHLRYFKAIEDIKYALQPWRIVYQGHYFNITEFDDYMEQHQTVKLTGVMYE